MSSALFPNPNEGTSSQVAHWTLLGFFTFCFIGWVDLAIYFFCALFLVIPWMMMKGGE